MKKILNTYLLLFLALATSYGQTNQDFLIQLQKGTLLIRLDDKHKEIEYYQKIGNLSMVQKLSEEVTSNHADIISDFNKHYQFSNKGYYYAKDAAAIINDKDYSKVFGLSKPLNQNEALFVAIKQRLSYAIMSNNMYYVIYKLTPTGLIQMQKPFPHKFRKGWFEQLFDNNPDETDAGRINRKFINKLAKYH